MTERNRNSAAQMQQEDMKKLFRELRITRILSTVSSLLAVLLLVGGGYLFFTIRDIMREARPAIEKISEVDMEDFNATLAHINETLETVDFEPVVQAIEELDVEGLNSAINSLDMEEFSEALRNMNDAAEAFKKLSQSFESLTSFFR